MAEKNPSPEEKKFRELFQKCQEEGITNIEDYLDDIFSFETDFLGSDKNGEPKTFTETKRFQIKSIICLAVLVNTQSQTAEELCITPQTLRSNLSREVYPLLTLLIEKRGLLNYNLRQKKDPEFPNRINDWRSVSDLYNQLKYEKSARQKNSQFIKKITIKIDLNTPEDIKNKILVDFQNQYPNTIIDLENN